MSTFGPVDFDENKVGAQSYAVGAIFDIAKGLFPVALGALLARRALGVAGILGAAWICLVIFSCLATHATVALAISAIERTGTWKMEVRGNTRAELASVEQQLAALSHPSLPWNPHVSAFVGERLRKIERTSIAFSELWSAYEAWCAARGRPPLSTPKFAAELKLLGYASIRGRVSARRPRARTATVALSCGLMRYGGLRLAA
jgi:hypothetical protein